MEAVRSPIGRRGRGSIVHPADLLGAVKAAVRVGAKFTEVALMLSRDEAIAAFETRAREPQDQRIETPLRSSHETTIPTP